MSERVHDDRECEVCGAPTILHIGMCARPGYYCPDHTHAAEGGPEWDVPLLRERAEKAERDVRKWASEAEVALRERDELAAALEDYAENECSEHAGVYDHTGDLRDCPNPHCAKTRAVLSRVREDKA